MIVSILAFLQNPWFPPGTDPTIKMMYRSKQDYHKRVLRGTATGYRLVAAFGEEMYQKIWWDNVAPEASDDPKKVTAVDMKHIDLLIDILKPHLILTFGKMANEALRNSISAIGKPILDCHHPNARFKTQSDLDDFAQIVRDWVLLHERKDEFTATDES